MADNLDTELLRTLIAIADTGSYAGAATTVHRSQSAISMQVKRLEEVVKQPIFEKQGRRSVLTSQGENLLLYARRIVKLQDEVMSTLANPEIQGEVRFGVCDDYVTSLIPPILVSFAEKYPNVHIKLHSLSSSQLIEHTLQGEFDFSLVNLFANEANYEVLVTCPLVWVSSANKLTHEQSPLPLALEGVCRWGKWAQQALDDTGINYRLAYSSPSHDGVSAFVHSGLAVAVMSQITVTPDLRILREADGFPALPQTSIGLVTKPTLLSPASRELINHIREEIKVEMS
ncbi:LysR substrate-binding domain-containing protein [Vibrio sp. RC27]